ncbi:prolipoprotein diacylglyceryl transferase family protein [Novosphingobium sp. M1R2S20]|uniref:Prolipoprotein diacylglyceryl transferase family protein n=1 Tax=Novosphingobium rhizovicinum TaxID=3228928 RepID=A0ABV3R7D7_9SPHN
MLHAHTAWWAHYLFDLAAWVGAALTARWQYRRWPDQAEALARITTPSYFVVLALGGVAGAWLAGSANSLRAIVAAPSHSLAGALAGAIVAVEGWKALHGVRGSTGGAFALPLATGIAIGRLGCFFTGLPDFTYGIPTEVPWAVDFGDGVGRHPVQLYEAATIAAFALLLVRARLRGADWARDHAFHALVLVYAGQRFVWEFFKPYPTLAGPLNLFHFLTLGLAAYAILWWRRDGAARAIG